MANPVPIQVKPGVVKTLTPNTLRNRWVDADKVRFETGKPAKIGGWEKAVDDLLDGVIRGCLAWQTIDGQSVFTGGTWRRLYTLIDGALDDITPLRTSGTLGVDPFAVSIGSPIVTVTHASHGVTQYANVNFSGASAGGGITISGEYAVTEVIDANSYTITHTSNATSTDSTTGGAAVAYEYEINPGYTSSVYGLGYGSGAYGSGTYGTPRTSGGIALDLRHWFIQTYNGSVLILPSGGTLYFWDQDGGDARAEAISNAPTARAMFVTAEGYVVALGTNDTPMRVRWPDRDDITDWTPSDNDTGNDRTLRHGSRLVAGTAVGDSMNLIWSDTATYFHQFTGDPETANYATPLAANNSGLVGPGAYCTADTRAFWMSPHGFQMFDGTVRDMPRQEEIRAWVFERLNRAHAAKSWAAFHSAKDEVWFGYVKEGEVEPTEYVICSLADFSWTPGTMDRTAMASYPTPLAGVVMAGSDSYLYNHETGVDADGSAMEAFIELGQYALGNGRVDMDVAGYIVDHERHAGDISLRIRLKGLPQDTADDDDLTTILAEGDTEADFFMGGRYATVRWTSNEVGGDFALGTPSLLIQPAGGR